MERKSEFEKEIHYKSCKCDCGKELRLRMPFYGSGEDSFNAKNKKLPKLVTQAEGKFIRAYRWQGIKQKLF